LVGHKPNTGFLGNQVKLDEKGYLLLDKHTMTSIPGVFACGDVADNRYRYYLNVEVTSLFDMIIYR
jgi:thioredoxin reductase (NADPH)